ncbi:MAG: HDOD domain-containing protein, partial [Planctomycetota bacterium]
MPSSARPLDKLIDRAGSLYTLPAVAMDVVRMTSDAAADTRALKEAIEGDPALTAKILRVVNSSLFGLSGEVGNLTQAIALLGAQPLKILVLGFSLPDRLLAGLTGDALRRYWATSLTRAVAARDIANGWFNATPSDLPRVQNTRRAASAPAQPPDRDPVNAPVNADDAYVAALLRDLGVLVLVQEIGEPYTAFLGKTVGSADRLVLERDSLGFDHVELTAQMLRQWRLPEALIAAARYVAPSDSESGGESSDAESSDAESSGSGSSNSETDGLAEVVWLAELL